MREYTVQGPNGPYTCLLDDRDAERLHAEPVKAKPVANKARKPKDKARG